MKILVVSQYYYPEPFRLHEICEELVSRGHKVTVLTGIPNYPDGEVYSAYKIKDCEETINGVKVIRCASRPRYKGYINLFLNYASFYFAASRRLKDINEDFDIVYTYQLSPVTSSIPAVKYSHKKNIPILMYCLDLWPESIVGKIPPRNVIFKFVRTLSERIYKACDKILVTSPSFISYLETVCSVNRLSMSYLPQHAEDVFPFIKNVTHEGLNFVFMGNVGVSQNIQCFIRACSLIEDRCGFKLHIVGSGSDLENAKTLAKDLDVEDCVVFHGRKPKSAMPNYYAMADVCLVSLRDEGAISWTIPGKVQEYMSAGKPILASIEGDAAFIIREASCGKALRNDDISGVANAIKEWVKNPSTLQEMGLRSRCYYENYFTLTKHIDSLEREFHLLLNKYKRACEVS